MPTFTLISLGREALKRPDAQVPLGILYIASVLLDAGYRTEVCNLALGETIPLADIYGITATSMELSEVQDLASQIHTLAPDSTILLGGPCSIGVSAEVANVSSVVHGEAEDVIFDIINDWPNVQDAYVGKETDVTNTPQPARHLITHHGGDVFAKNKHYYRTQTTQLITSRGCPFKCSFCAASFLGCGKVRYREPEDIYQEVKSCVENYGIRQFRLADDMLTSDRDHFYEVCKVMRMFDVVWRMSARTYPLEYEMLSVAKKSGCREVSFGIESFDDAVLKAMKKGTTCEQNVAALRMAKKAKLKARALMMVGTPGQTPETIELNKWYLTRVPYTIVACTIFVPVPGSDVWFNPDKYRVDIITRDMGDYNFYFFGPTGENNIRPILNPWDRSVEDFYAETIGFRNWLKQNVRLNTG